MKTSIKELRDRRAAKKVLMQEITAKETDESPLTDEDVESFNALKDECDRLEQRISRLTASADDSAQTATEVSEDAGEKAWSGERMLSDVKHFNINTPNRVRIPTKQAGETAGRWIVAQWWAKEFGVGAAKDMVEKEMGDDIVRKSVMMTTQPIIPQDFNPDWIELLQAKSVVRQFASVYPMPNGNMTIPRQQLGSTGQFFAEAVEVPVSNQNFDNIQLTFHKYGALSYCSRELLEFTPLNAASIIANDLTSRLGLLEDKTFLIGSGASNTPKGILPQVNQTTNKITSTNTAGTAPTFQQVGFDLQAVELALAGNLVDGPYNFIMHPSVVAFLKQVVTAYGVYPFAEQLNNGTLNGHKVYTTTQLATNTGTSGANQTAIILVKGSDCIIGDAFRFALSMTTEGSFTDTGTQVNTFGQDLVAFKATNGIDFALKHDVSAAYLLANNYAMAATANIDQYTQTANTSASSASSAAT